jgi:hypothetical protein
MIRKWQIHKLLFGPHVLLHMYGHSTHVKFKPSFMTNKNTQIQMLSFVIFRPVTSEDNTNF